MSQSNKKQSNSSKNKKQFKSILKNSASAQGSHPPQGKKQPRPQTPSPQPQFQSRSHKGKHSGNHRPNQIRGHGDYSIGDGFKKAWDVIDNDVPSEGVVNKIAKDIGNTVGGVLGVGRQAGNALSYFSRLLGFGDYKKLPPGMLHPKYTTPGHRAHIKYNTLLGSAPPTFSGAQGSDFVVTNDETVCDVMSSDLFTTQKFVLNPGNPVLFPWFSTIAKTYEECQILGLVFEFRTSATSYSATPGLGTVTLGTDYDCLDENFTSQREIAGSEFSVDKVTDESFLHPVECDPSRNVFKRMFIVDTNDVTVIPGDPRLSCAGVTYIATEGMNVSVDTPSTKVGELKVHYHIKVSRPIVEASDTKQTGFSQHIHATTTNDGVDTINVVTIISNEVNGGDAFDVLASSGSNASGSCRVKLTNNTLLDYQLFAYCQMKNDTYTNIPHIYNSPASGLSMQFGGSTQYLLGDHGATSSEPTEICFGLSNSDMDTTFPVTAGVNGAPSSWFVGGAFNVPAAGFISFMVPYSDTYTQNHFDIRLFTFTNSVTSRHQKRLNAIRNTNNLSKIKYEIIKGEDLKIPTQPHQNKNISTKTEDGDDDFDDYIKWKEAQKINKIKIVKDNNPKDVS